MRKHAWILAVALLGMPGCDSGNGGGDGEVSAPDVPMDAVGDLPSDGSVDVPSDAPAEVPSDVPVDAPADGIPDGVEPGPFGFVIRVPQDRQIPEKDFQGGTQMVTRSDVDHVCTFPESFPKTYLYIQANPTRCEMMMGCFYDTQGAWVSVDGVLEAIQGAHYDFGGNHANDWVEVPYQGKVYRFFHSTLGFGGRRCQPMDCVQIKDTDENVLEDGCTKERTVPVTCVVVDADGKVPGFPTTFSKCPGDPNA